MGVLWDVVKQEAGVVSWSGWNLWVCTVVVVVRRYIDFPILLIPTALVSAPVGSIIDTFCSPCKMFFILVYVRFVRFSNN